MDQTEILQLYASYHTDVYRLAYSYTGSREDAEDVTQSTFLRLAETQPKLFSGKEKAWLLQVAVNQCKNLRKSAWKTRTVSLEVMQDFAFESGKETALFRAVMALPPKERLAVHLHYYEGYKLREIAAMLKLPLSAVSMRLHRAREHLKEFDLEGSL